MNLTLNISTYEIISLILSLFAILISIITWIKTSLSSSANLELYMNERITNTKEKVSDISIQLSDYISDKKSPKYITLQKAFTNSLENNFNAYEEACAKYLDRKVDKTRFKKNYKNEIKRLVENEETKQYFNGVSSNYRAIIKVYKMWEDLEK